MFELAPIWEQGPLWATRPVHSARAFPMIRPPEKAFITERGEGKKDAVRERNAIHIPLLFFRIYVSPGPHVSQLRPTRIDFLEESAAEEKSISGPRAGTKYDHHHIILLADISRSRRRRRGTQASERRTNRSKATHARVPFYSYVPS